MTPNTGDIKMDNLDKIIKYLSGDMNAGQADKFETELTQDPSLKRTFEEVRKIWDTILRGLRLEEISENPSPDEIIAEVQAAIDVAEQDRTSDEKVEEFRSLLDGIKTEQGSNYDVPESEGDPEPPKVAVKRGKRRRPLTVYLALISTAAAVGLLLFIPLRSTESMTSEWFDDGVESLLATYDATTRSKEEIVVSYYRNGFYDKALKMLDENAYLVEEHAVLQIVQAMANLKLGDTLMCEKLLLKIEPVDNDTVFYQANWFLGLLYTETEQYDRAKDVLETLINHNGPHRKRAGKLIHRLESDR